MFNITYRSVIVLVGICAIIEICIIAYGFNLLLKHDFSKPFKVVHEVQFIQNGTNTTIEINK